MKTIYFGLKYRRRSCKYVQWGCIESETYIGTLIILLSSFWQEFFFQNFLLQNYNKINVTTVKNVYLYDVFSEPFISGLLQNGIFLYEYLLHASNSNTIYNNFWGYISLII